MWYYHVTRSPPFTSQAFPTVVACALAFVNRSDDLRGGAGVFLMHRDWGQIPVDESSPAWELTSMISAAAALPRSVLSPPPRRLEMFTIHVIPKDLIDAWWFFPDQKLFVVHHDTIEVWVHEPNPKSPPAVLVGTTPDVLEEACLFTVVDAVHLGSCSILKLKK